MAYQFAKSRDMSPRESGASDPYAVLLAKLSGIKVLKRPRKHSALEIYQQANLPTILKPLIDEACLAMPTVHRITHQFKITKQHYDALTREQKDEWEREARRDHEERVAEWRAATDAPPSTEPEDRQL